MLSEQFHASVQVAEEQRDYARQLACSLLSGKSPYASAVDLSCDVKKAAKQQESFMGAIPNVVMVTPVPLVSVVSPLLPVAQLLTALGEIHCEWPLHLQLHRCTVMSCFAAAHMLFEGKALQLA